VQIRSKISLFERNLQHLNFTELEGNSQGDSAAEDRL